MSKKYVSISELEQGDAKTPIWALNGSAESEISQPGEVHVGIPKINGTKIDDLYLPQTWLPICLTDLIPRQQLLAASEFRNAVNNNLVVLITAEFASEIQAQDGAREERARLTEHKRAIREETGARSITGSGAEIVSQSELMDPKEAEPEVKDALSASFVMFANNLESKSDIEALNLIRGRGKFTGKECMYMIKNLHDKPKTVEFIKAKRKK